MLKIKIHCKCLPFPEGVIKKNPKRRQEYYEPLDSMFSARLRI
jgi:hypothetical protein